MDKRSSQYANSHLQHQVGSEFHKRDLLDVLESATDKNGSRLSKRRDYRAALRPAKRQNTKNVEEAIAYAIRWKEQLQGKSDMRASLPAPVRPSRPLGPIFGNIRVSDRMRRGKAEDLLGKKDVTGQNCLPNLALQSPYFVQPPKSLHLPLSEPAPSSFLDKIPENDQLSRPQTDEEVREQHSSAFAISSDSGDSKKNVPFACSMGSRNSIFTFTPSIKLAEMAESNDFIFSPKYADSLRQLPELRHKVEVAMSSGRSLPFLPAHLE